jgi:hypothetical protein
MRAEFLTIGILILDNLKLDFPKPEKYACRILNYWNFNYLKCYTGFPKA